MRIRQKIFSNACQSNLIFGILCSYLFFVFVTGGGSRPDIISLVILRPLAVLLCGIALFKITRAHLIEYRLLFIISAVIFLLVAVQLIPLPPFIWQQLPGREIVIEVDRTVGLEAIWRPISMTPGETWNALYSLFVPLAMLLLAVQVTPKQRQQLLAALLILGFISGLWGVLQVIGDPNGPAYLFRITNNGSAVGLFANRNHAAVFLAMLFPMLAVYSCTGIRSEDQRKLHVGLALAGGAFLIPLLLVTGSRAGLIAGIIGLLSAALLYKKPKIDSQRKGKGAERFNWHYLVAGFAVLSLVSLTAIASRAQALQRLLLPDQSEDLRFSTFSIVVAQAWSVLPFGSGYGSFVDMYKVIEPSKLLGPSYFNHAHNDWLELYLTGGLPALFLLTAVVFAVFRQGVRIFQNDVPVNRQIIYGRLGFVMIVIFGLASIVDYPLRVPSMMCVFVIAAIWLHDAFREPKNRVCL